MILFGQRHISFERFLVGIHINPLFDLIAGVDARIRSAQEALFSKDYPELNTLRSRHGPSVAFALSSFLARWRQDGFESAASSLGISRSTAYRYKKLLHESDVDCLPVAPRPAIILT